MMISVWANPIVIFILIGAQMMEQLQVIILCQGSIGKYTKIFIKKSQILECLLIVIEYEDHAHLLTIYSYLLTR